MQTFRYDDIEGIKGAISDEFGDWGPEVTVSQEMINDFAELTGDRQWIHIDVERCEKESPFGGPIAHGFLTLSLLPQISPVDIGLTDIINAVNYGSAGLQFRSPVPSGSTVHAHARLVDVEQKKQGTLLNTEVAVHVVGNDKPALIYQMLVLYMGG